MMEHIQVIGYQYFVLMINRSVMLHNSVGFICNCLIESCFFTKSKKQRTVDELNFVQFY